MNHIPEVVLIGHVGINITNVENKSPTQTVGGAAYHAAIGALTVEGIRVGIVARVGKDEFGDQIHDTLTELEIHTRGIRRVRGQTAVFRQRESSIGMRQGIKVDLGVASAVDTKILPSNWNKAMFIHLATAPPEQYLQWQNSFKRMQPRPRHLSLDAFELYAFNQPDLLIKAIEGSNLFFLNEVELAVLQHRIEKSRKHDGFPEVPYILKRGERGAIYKNVSAHSEIEVRALDVAVRDTTGAGDILAGAFLASRANRWELEDSLRWAVRKASESITQVGVEHILDRAAIVYDHSAK